MPLRDHFHPPLSRKASWEVLHGQWPARLVQQLRTTLPPGFVAGPTVHHGARIEVDIAAYEKTGNVNEGPQGGVATATWLAPLDLQTETDLDFDAYEVKVYDEDLDQQLVAAIEIVSPANKDRPDTRHAFVTKCAALLQAGVAVSVVDIVTIRQFNLYSELMESIGHPISTPGSQAEIYTACCRTVRRNPRGLLQSWSRVLQLGQSLPSIPLWLGEAVVVKLDLEQAYEEACHDVWIT